MPSDIFYTSNENEIGKLEGLYILERDPAGFIRGRDLGVVGWVGKCVRGPDKPVYISSSGRFLEVFGGRSVLPGGTLVGEIWKAMLGKPWGEMYVRRVVAADAVKATKNFSDVVPTAIIRVDATSKGAWGNELNVAIEAATDGDATHFNLRVTYGSKEKLYENLNTTGTANNLVEVVGDEDANWITISKLANGRPLNIAATPLLTGSDGTLVVGDYDTAVTEMAYTDGPSIVLVPEAVPTHSSFNATLVTLAAQVNDRIFLTWSGVHGQTPSQEAAAVAAQITTRSDRIVWCYNSGRVADPVTGLKMDVAPHTWMASVLSQNDVDVHPGAQKTAKQNAGIRELVNQGLTRGDLVQLKAAGISTLEKLRGKFLFRSGLTTDLNPGKTEITRRRMADFLILSASDRLVYFVKEKNTPEVRAEMVGELTTFSELLRDQQRVVENFAVDSDSVNNVAQRARGEERILWRVALIKHILHLVLETDISTGVVIESNETAAAA